MKYKIGQEVWWARYESTAASIECPDCAGKGFISVTMGDEEVVTVDCQNCRIGYEAFSRGRVKTHARTGYAQKTVIKGMNVSETKVEYHIPQSYTVLEGMLFDTHDEALAAATVLAEEANAMEHDKIQGKEKDTKSWAWNATYHRGCIRRAKKDIEYHTKKLNVAKEKAKEQKRSDKCQ